MALLAEAFLAHKTQLPRLGRRAVPMRSRVGQSGYCGSTPSQPSASAKLCCSGGRNADWQHLGSAVLAWRMPEEGVEMKVAVVSLPERELALSMSGASAPPSDRRVPQQDRSGR